MNSLIARLSKLIISCLLLSLSSCDSGPAVKGAQSSPNDSEPSAKQQAPPIYRSEVVIEIKNPNVTIKPSSDETKLLLRDEITEEELERIHQQQTERVKEELNKKWPSDIESKD